MGDVLRVKRGQATDLPPLMQGEMGYNLDEAQMYVGGVNGNNRLTSPKFNFLNFVNGISHTNAMSNLLELIGARKATILLEQEDYEIANITIPSNITLEFMEGAIITIPEMETLTLNCKIKAGLYQIFNVLGTLAGTPIVKNVYPDWFADDLQKTMNFVGSSGNKVRLLPKTYNTTGFLLPKYANVSGSGVKTVINYVGDGSKNVVDTVDNPERITFINAKINGDGMNSGHNVSGLYVKPILVTPENYDTQHIFTGLTIQNCSGYGAYIGASNRGCKLEKIYTANNGKTGIYVDGTDNMICFCSAGSSGELGIYLNTNNRLVSCKAFLSGLIDGVSGGIKILNYNNIVNLDLQQNAHGGIEIAGNGNYVNFESDGIGTGVINESGTISVIKMTEPTASVRYNTIIGSITSGRFDGYFNYVLDIAADAQFNHIYVTCQNPKTSVVTARDYRGTLSASNKFMVNNRDVNKSLNLLADGNSFKPVCTGYTGLSNITCYQGLVEYTFPIAMSAASLNGGCSIRYTFDAPLIAHAKNYNRMELIAHIKANIPIDENIQYGFWVMQNGVQITGTSALANRKTGGDVAAIFTILGNSITDMVVSPFIERIGTVTDNTNVIMQVDEFKLRFFNV